MSGSELPRGSVVNFFTRKSVEMKDRTISQFGEQWETFSEDTGFFGSKDLLADFVNPFDCAKFRGANVGDLGAGGGRFSIALLEFGAQHVFAIEPSESVRVIRRKAEALGLADRITILNVQAHQVLAELQLDYIVSLGVIHHIPHPRPAVEAAINALRPGGMLIVWLYAKEGNALYLAMITPIRILCRLFSLRAKSFLVRILDIPLVFYIWTCKLLPALPLPLSTYMRSILARLDSSRRRLVIYDQLSPDYAKYYKKEDVIELFSGLGELELHWRKRYSWLAFVRKTGL